jgi:hypothetical protein
MVGEEVTVAEAMTEDGPVGVDAIVTTEGWSRAAARRRRRRWLTLRRRRGRNASGSKSQLSGSEGVATI